MFLLEFCCLRGGGGLAPQAFGSEFLCYGFGLGGSHTIGSFFSSNGLLGEGFEESGADPWC